MTKNLQFLYNLRILCVQLTLPIMLQKHSFSPLQAIAIDQHLAKQLVEQKKKYAEEEEKMQTTFNSDWIDMYVISNKFLDQWKAFTNYQYNALDLAPPAQSVTPGEINQDIIHQRLSFGQAILNENCKYRVDFEVVSSEAAKMFERYSGKPTHRRAMISGQSVKFNNFTIIKVFFISSNWYNVAYRSSSTKIPSYSCISYDSQSVKSLLQRLGQYSKQDNRNKGNGQAKLWRCSQNFTLQDYCVSIKSALRKQQGIKQAKLAAPGTELSLEDSVGYLCLAESLLAVQLKDKHWIYDTISQQGNGSSIKKPTSEFKMVKVCNFCKKQKAEMEIMCEKCKQIDYCSKECHQKDVFHTFSCGKPKQVDTLPAQTAAAPLPLPNKGKGGPLPSWKFQPNNPDSYSKVNAKQGVVGLQNIGNTCYMNSALQCLSHSKDLTNYFLEDHYIQEINKENIIGSKGKLANQYAKFLRAMWKDCYSKYTPSDLKVCIGQIAPFFQGYEQHDSQEFLLFMLDNLHEDLNRILDKPLTDSIESQGRPDELVARLSWMNHLKRNRSIITDLFGGQFKSRVTCPNCDLHSLTFEPYLIVPVPIPEDGSQQLNLYFFFNNYNQESKKITIKCATNSLDEVKAALQKVTKVPLQRMKLIVSGFNGTVRQVNADDTIKRLISEKALSQLGEQRQIFGVQYGKEELIDIEKKEFLTFKFTNADGKAIHFKRMFPFFTQELEGQHLYDRICRFVERVWSPHRSYGILREEVAKGQGFRIIMNFGGMKVSKDRVVFNGEEEVQEKTKLSKRIEQYRGQLEFQVRMLHNRKMELNIFKTHRQNDHNPKFNTKTNFTLEECFKHFALTEILEGGNEWFCPRCEDRVIAEKQMEIYKCPRYLIIQLKRFKQKGMKKVKNEANVRYPLQLDMKPFTLNPTLPETYFLNQDTQDQVSSQFQKGRKIIQSDDCKYELYGVVNHMGSLMGGHYISKAKNEGKWYRFDDSYVSSIGSNEVQESAAYLLFYKLIV